MKLALNLNLLFCCCLVRTSNFAHTFASNNHKDSLLKAYTDINAQNTCCTCNVGRRRDFGGCLEVGMLTLQMQ